MTYRVRFSPEAEEQLVGLFGYLAEAASVAVAARYTEAIVRYCESLVTFPHRGRKREDVRPGLRIIPYRKRVVIAFLVEGEVISILGIFSGGQDYETILREEDDEREDASISGE